MDTNVLNVSVKVSNENCVVGRPLEKYFFSSEKYLNKTGRKQEALRA